MTTRDIENCIYDLERKHNVACRMLCQAQDAFFEKPTEENKNILDATRRAMLNVDDELKRFMYQEWEMKSVSPIISADIQHVGYDKAACGYEK